MSEDNTKTFVILRSLSTGERFYMLNNGGDPTRLTDGSVAYSVLAYRDTAAECQMYLFGRTYS